MNQSLDKWCQKVLAFLQVSNKLQARVKKATTWGRMVSLVRQHHDLEFSLSR